MPITVKRHSRGGRPVNGYTRRKAGPWTWVDGSLPRDAEGFQVIPYYECDYCDAKFHSDRARQQHVRRVHRRLRFGIGTISEIGRR